MSTMNRLRKLLAATLLGVATFTMASPSVPIADAQRIYVARTYAYVAAGADGLAIVDVWKAAQPKLLRYFNADGQIHDTRASRSGTTAISSGASGRPR